MRRRFLNVVLRNRLHTSKSLHRIDLQRQSFFFDSPAATTINPADAKKPASGLCQFKANGAIRLPAPAITFAVSPPPYDRRMHLLPFTENEIACLSHSGKAALYDARQRRIVTMTSLVKPKKSPISISFRDTTLEDEGGPHHLYVMERLSSCSPCHQLEFQFEAFVPEKLQYSSDVIWHWCHVPLPSFSHLQGEPEHMEIKSYAVLRSGSHILLSLEAIGTYCLDTLRHTWSHVGEWTLPFHGKAEYAPELGLWFGLSAKDHVLCAADLSNLGSKPQLVDSWKELEPSKRWLTAQDAQLIYLGSGRFCIARFFHEAPTTNSTGGVATTFDDAVPSHDVYSRDEWCKSFSIMTGVEVLPRGSVEDHNASDSVIGDGAISYNDNSSGNNNGKGLQMIKHKSKRYTYNGGGNIESVF